MIKERRLTYTFQGGIFMSFKLGSSSQPGAIKWANVRMFACIHVQRELESKSDEDRRTKAKYQDSLRSWQGVTGNTTSHDV